MKNKKTTDISFKFSDIEFGVDDINIIIPEPNKKPEINKNIVDVIELKPKSKKTNGRKFERKTLI
ncbi:MAG: hypothetical protein RSE41_06985 [Clostridia bacterium]